MKILFVHNRYLQSAGGEDAAVEAEIQLLISKGHTVETVYFNNESFNGPLLSKIKAGIRTIYNNNSKQLLINAIQHFKPAIIHVHNFYFQASPAVFDAASECGIPVVFTIHNFRLVCVNALLLRNNKVCEACVNSFFAWKGILHKCYHNSVMDSTMVALISTSHKIRQTWTKKIDRFITPSHFSRAKLLHSSLGIKDESKIVVKRNFIPDPGFGSVAERENHYLFVGRLSEEKGVKFLLEVFADLTDKQLLIAGDGPQKEELTARFGNNKNILFLGKKERKEILQLLKTCKALIFPSICYEGLPLTIIEAFATGTPVIGSRLGGMEEMIIPGVNGLLFTKENKAELLQALRTIDELKITKDHSLHEGARHTYLTTYHPEVCYREAINIYNAIITEHKQRH